MNLVGREPEQAIMAKLLRDDDSNFLAVYGRRRIGKTYMIREFYKKNMVFEASGINEKDKSQQLENFWLSQYDFEKVKREKPKTWLQAFQNLKEFIESIKGKEKKVIFLDEINQRRVVARSPVLLGVIDDVGNAKIPQITAAARDH